MQKRRRNKLPEFPKTVVVLSGGCDSTALLYHLRAEHHHLVALSVDYGQRHRERELAAAFDVATGMGIEYEQVNLSSLVTLMGNNCLTDHQVAVPKGAYSAETMAQTVVPNRNMILLSVALSWAASLKFDAVAFGAHGGAYTPYADCQPPFAKAMHRAAQHCHEPGLHVLAPFVTWTKAEIVKHGTKLGVPWQDTYSCYRGETKHCGQCGTCIDRKTAFREAGVPDPTEYANHEPKASATDVFTSRKRKRR